MLSWRHPLSRRIAPARNTDFEKRLAAMIYLSGVFAACSYNVSDFAIADCTVGSHGGNSHVTGANARPIGVPSRSKVTFDLVFLRW